jgi:hypothetical protein
MTDEVWSVLVEWSGVADAQALPSAARIDPDDAGRCEFRGVAPARAWAASSRSAVSLPQGRDTAEPVVVSAPFTSLDACRGSAS